MRPGIDINHFPGATQYLSSWCVNASGDWPPHVLRLAEHELEDTVAAMIAGCGGEGPAAVRRTLPVGDVPVVGSVTAASPVDAALANGCAAHSRELDEMYIAGIGHLGCVVVPALLSVGHAADATLDAVLDALIVGSEVMGRLGLAMDRSHVVHGWHGTATMGVLAAAASCGRLMRLNAEQMTHALSIAVSMAAGPIGQFGTSVKPLHAGLAAAGGVRAAQLAACGITGNPHILEGEHGFDHLYAGNVQANWLKLQGIGDPLVVSSHGLVFKLP